MKLITGATGRLGQSVVAQLLTKTSPGNIAILVRDKQKAVQFEGQGVETRIGDFNDKTTLQAALKGIDEVLLISGTALNRYEQHKNVIDAAKSNGVKRVGYTGVTMKSLESSANKFLMQDHFNTEVYIQESGLRYTFYRNTLYTDTVIFFSGENTLESGISLPVGTGKVSFALRRELGEAIANDLAEEYDDNRMYELTGSAAYSYEEVARELSALSGKNVVFTDVSPTIYTEQLVKAGVPDPFIQVLNAFATDIKNGQNEKVTGDLERLLGRKPIDFSLSLKELFSL